MFTMTSARLLTLLNTTETDEAQTDHRHQGRLKTGPNASLEML